MQQAGDYVEPSSHTTGEGINSMHCPILQRAPAQRFVHPLRQIGASDPHHAPEYLQVFLDAQIRI